MTKALRPGTVTEAMRASHWWKGISWAQPISALRCMLRDQTGRRAVMFAGVALGASAGPVACVLCPSLGVMVCLQLTSVVAAITAILAREFWLWRTSRLAKSQDLVHRRLYERAVLEDELADIDRLRLEPAAAAKRRDQVWRQHRARLLQKGLL